MNDQYSKSGDIIKDGRHRCHVVATVQTHFWDGEL
jgi:hypothetical protein